MSIRLVANVLLPWPPVPSGIGGGGKGGETMTHLGKRDIRIEKRGVGSPYKRPGGQRKGGSLRLKQQEAERQFLGGEPISKTTPG